MKTSIRLVTVLTMTALAMNTYAAEPGETDLFAAGDFSLWTQVNGEPVGEGCQINKGVVTLTGGKSGDIITREHYNDFELSFEWKISEGGNSGVKYRSKGKLGLEAVSVQAADGSAVLLDGGYNHAGKGRVLCCQNFKHL